MPLSSIKQVWRSSAPVRAFCLVVGVGLLFAAFAAGVGSNPPGYYLDESVLSYNAYLVAETGAGESGVKFPLFFPVYTAPHTQYANPTHIYLLAAVFKVFGPGIVTARLFASLCVFAACLLLGLLARRISGSTAVAVIIAAASLATPWMFEMGRVVLEVFFYPLAVVLLLWSVYRASLRDRWGLWDTAAIVGSLSLLTYSYTVGRLLGPLLAGGLVLFATSRKRVVSVLRVWVVFAVALVPLAVYVQQHPQISVRFKLISYIRPDASVATMARTFAGRFIEDVNPAVMLIEGDMNPRHHLPGRHGSFYVGLFLLSVFGVFVIVYRHRRSSWWLYVLFGLLAAAVPGALTNDQFHTLRMAAYPVFLLILCVPALSWLLGSDEPEEHSKTFGVRSVRHAVMTGLLTATVIQAGHFFWLYYRDGRDRGDYFDASYKSLYDEAVAQPERPIHLVDGYWGPAYIHAYWYATLEGRGLDEFVHVPYGRRAPPGALVLSSEKECSACELIRSDGVYHLYIVEGLDDQGSPTR